MREFIPLVIAAAITLAVFSYVVPSLVVLVPPGKALHVVSGLRRGESRVCFTDKVFVWPLIERADLIDLDPIAIHLRPEGLACADQRRADVSLTFHLRIGRAAEDVRRVVRELGIDHARAAPEFFKPRFTEALRAVLAERALGEHDPKQLAKRLRELLGAQLAGFTLDGITVETLTESGGARDGQEAAYRDALAATRARIEGLKKELEEAEETHAALAERARK